MCTDMDGWMDVNGDTCSDYTSLCNDGGWIAKGEAYSKQYAKDGISARDACCDCGGGQEGEKAPESCYSYYDVATVAHGWHSTVQAWTASVDGDSQIGCDVGIPNVCRCNNGALNCTTTVCSRCVRWCTCALLHGVMVLVSTLARVGMGSQHVLLDVQRHGTPTAVLPSPRVTSHNVDGMCVWVYVCFHV